MLVIRRYPAAAVADDSEIEHCLPVAPVTGVAADSRLVAVAGEQIVSGLGVPCL